MTYPELPARNVLMELVGAVPDGLRRRVSRARKHVRTLPESEIDGCLEQADELFARSDDEARSFLASFEMQAPSLPDDPFSEAYASAQWDLYRRVARRDTYDLANEETDLDLARCVRYPYPYSTTSAQQVASQLAACSFIIRLLDPRPGQRIVEFGPGWGNLTLDLAMLSIETTAVEVSAGFAELIRQRGRGIRELTVVESGMLEFRAEQEYDAAVFFESFHHCADHLEMLSRLRSMITVDGVVCFAGEPILSQPYPWGLRLDGMSLFCTRRYGWLELGFDNRYFDQALRRTGWTGRRYRSRSMTPLADVLLASRAVS